MSGDASRGAARKPAALDRSWFELVVLGGVCAAVLLLSIALGGHDTGGIGGLVLGTAASVLLFVICGDALAVALFPAVQGVWLPLAGAALGAASSGLVLTVLGFAHVPLHVSLWVTLAAGLAASMVVRRRIRPRGWTAGWRRPVAWGAASLIVFGVAISPALLTNTDTIYGENPDSHQVVGIAVLFQHVPPQGRDDALPIDTVPPAWRFRYPIFYALAGASNLSHLDPIRVFPTMAALLMVLAALGFAVLAVSCLAAPPSAGPVIAVVVGLAQVPLYLVWHPYWNQLWGLALMPYALLFGWRAVAARDRAAAGLFALMLIALVLAYPLAAPYPLVLIAAVAWAHGLRPRLPGIAGRRRWISAVLALVVLLPALAGAALKLEQGIAQLFSAHSKLWSGDIFHLTPIGNFVGTGGGVVPAALVLVLAGVGLRAMPLREAIALGAVLLVLLAIDLRFRIGSGGGYMDFKHLSYVGTIVLVLAAATVARWVASGSRITVAAGAVIAITWVGAALVQDRRQRRANGPQVTRELFEIRAWAARLPRGSSVRVDLPASGEQLWAVYMLSAHPVDAVQPVVHTTYAYAPFGLRADYALAWRYASNGDPRYGPPLAPVLYARDPAVFENDRYILRRIVWPAKPAKLASVPDTSSTALVEP